MPTSKPRYTVTDTGELEALLDAAQRRWPETPDRKDLLLRPAEEGAAALGLEPRLLGEQERRALATAALSRIARLVDERVLLSDQAWG